ALAPSCESEAVHGSRPGTPIHLGLQQHWIHVDASRQATRLGLHRLRTADLTASRADRGIVRHVLRLEGRDADTAAREGPAQRGHDDTFADVRRGSHYHQGLGAHQNSTIPYASFPAWANSTAMPDHQALRA